MNIAKETYEEISLMAQQLNKTPIDTVKYALTILKFCISEELKGASIISESKKARKILKVINWENGL